jgi:hypothetical protein
MIHFSPDAAADVERVREFLGIEVIDKFGDLFARLLRRKYFSFLVIENDSVCGRRIGRRRHPSGLQFFETAAAPTEA